MTYRVELTDRAARDLGYLYQHIHGADSLAAARWFNGLERAVHSLEHHPLRCALAPEANEFRGLRHLFYGRKPHVYRILFQFDAGNKIVHVITIRHGARERFSQRSQRQLTEITENSP